MRLEDWIVAQLLGDYRLVLDWQVQRQLTGVAKRLWYYLGARGEDFAHAVVARQAELDVELSDAFMDSLSLTGSTCPRPARRAGARRRPDRPSTRATSRSTSTATLPRATGCAPFAATGSRAATSSRRPRPPREGWAALAGR